VIPFLQGIPADLKPTGGESAFQAVSVSIVASKMDFSEKYAVDHTFTVEDVFPLTDVESFVNQKIDTQALLDRGHLTQDDVGRISLKYNSGD
jgi:hypothetical protein